MNSHTDAVRFGILSVPDRGVILLGAEEAGGPRGGQGWMSDCRLAQALDMLLTQAGTLTGTAASPHHSWMEWF